MAHRYLAHGGSSSARAFAFAGLALAMAGFARPASASEEARPLSSPRSTKKPFGSGIGAGWVYGYQWGAPLAHSVSMGVILGEAETSFESRGGCPHIIPDLPGARGNGALLQADIGTRALKLSAGYSRAAMIYVPPAAAGWAVKASYLQPYRDDTFPSARYVGGEVEAAFLARLSLGVYRGLGPRSDVLVTWGVGVGF